MPTHLKATVNLYSFSLELIFQYGFPLVQPAKSVDLVLVFSPDLKLVSHSRFILFQELKYHQRIRICFQGFKRTIRRCMVFCSELTCRLSTRPFKTSAMVNVYAVRNSRGLVKGSQSRGENVKIKKMQRVA